MRGEVLKPDDTSGPGLILGEDGRRYNFITPHVHKQAALAAGAKVDFIGLGEEARDIYVLGAPGSADEKPPINVDEAYKPVVATRADGFFKYFFRTLSKNYFQFYGRARRKEYWSYFILWIISLVLLATADAVIAGVFLGNSADYFPILTVLFFIYCIVPGIAVTIRRLHDQDMSGWVYLVNAIPYIGGLIIFILMFFDSRPNPNKHGPSPKYGAAQTVNTFD